MGKSNKFDYTNRPNSGAKLGQIIGSALQKEAEKVKKDADRHLQKARKQSTDSSSALVDVTTTTHVIDLRAPSKGLGDEGVCALLDGLGIGLRSGSSQASLVLEDLDLSGNGITTAPLARLAPVLGLAKHHLKTLNLANNKIKVETDQQAEEWETFLRGFKDCVKLRKIDLSGNLELGCRALEIFARVHFTQRHFHTGDESPAPLTSSDTNVSNDDGRYYATGYSNACNTYDNTATTTPWQTKRRCGLRSVPYITLHNIGLDDAGALWLSYVLQDHPYPNQLLDELNVTPCDSSVKIHQQEADLSGIGWRENKMLGRDGAQLLEKTEGLRGQTMRSDSISPADQFGDEADSVLGDLNRDRRKSSESKIFKSMQESRRSSVKSAHTADSIELEASEVQSIRKKIQRAIIAHDGASSVELWHTAIRFVRASRLLLYLTPTTRKIHTGPPVSKGSDAILSPRPPPSQCPVGNAATKGKRRLTIDTEKAAAHVPKSQMSCAVALQSPTNITVGSSQAVTTGINTPATPKILQKPMHRKGAFSEGDDLHSVTDKLNVLLIRRQDPARFVKYQENRLSKATRNGREFRDTAVPCQLPFHVMEHLMAFLMSDRETSVLSDRQKGAAFDWGQRKESLMTEREWLRKDESTQVLMLLDCIDCLAYDH